MKRKSPGTGPRRNYRFPIVLLYCIAAAVTLISLFRETGLLGVWKLYKTERQLDVENMRIRKENEQLLSEVKTLRTSPERIEQEARILGLVKDNEDVIVLDPKREPAALPPAGPAPARGGSDRP